MKSPFDAVVELVGADCVFNLDEPDEEVMVAISYSEGASFKKDRIHILLVEEGDWDDVKIYSGYGKKIAKLIAKVSLDLDVGFSTQTQYPEWVRFANKLDELMVRTKTRKANKKSGAAIGAAQVVESLVPEDVYAEEASRITCIKLRAKSTCKKSRRTHHEVDGEDIDDLVQLLPGLGLNDLATLSEAVNKVLLERVRESPTK
jgi:hypothetical protein